MVLGVGLDICEIERMKRRCSSETFRRKVFTPAELAWKADSAGRFIHLAAAFAAREAFAKATGLGLAKTGLHNVSVVHDHRGRPFLALNFQCQALKPYENARFHLSLSHDGGMAAAVVIYES